MAKYRIKIGSHCIAGRIYNVGDVFEVKNDKLAKHPDYENVVERVFPDEIEEKKKQQEIDEQSVVVADSSHVVDDDKISTDIPKPNRGRPPKKTDIAIEN